MTTFITGKSIFDSEAIAWVNPVNCVGVMGKGLALEFKKRFSENYKNYRKACKEGKVQPGWMWIQRRFGKIDPAYIINFPTKRHWKDASRLEDIEEGLKALVKVINTHRIKTIAVPPLGCGLGGLDWVDVRPLIEKAAEETPECEWEVFEP